MVQSAYSENEIGCRRRRRILRYKYVCSTCERSGGKLFGKEKWGNGVGGGGEATNEPIWNARSSSSSFFFVPCSSDREGRQLLHIPPPRPPLYEQIRNFQEFAAVHCTVYLDRAVVGLQPKRKSGQQPNLVHNLLRAHFPPSSDGWRRDSNFGHRSWALGSFGRECSSRRRGIPRNTFSFFAAAARAGGGHSFSPFLVSSSSSCM